MTVRSWSSGLTEVSGELSEKGQGHPYWLAAGFMSGELKSRLDARLPMSSLSKHAKTAARPKRMPQCSILRSPCQQS